MKTWDEVREKRNELLNDADIMINKMHDTGDALYPSAISYRQQLRDVPENFDKPSKVKFPSIPTPPKVNKKKNK